MSLKIGLMMLLADARTLLADTPSAAPAMAPAMSAAAAPDTAAAAAAAPATAPAPANDYAPVVPQATPAPQGCALSFVQGNSSYSKFQQILNAAPSTSNFSSECPSNPARSHLEENWTVRVGQLQPKPGRQHYSRDCWKCLLTCVADLRNQT